MLLFLYFIGCFFVFILVYCINKRSKTIFSPVSIMVYIWLLFLFLAIVFGEQLEFYKINYTVVLASFVFLIIICSTTLLFLKKVTRKNNYSLEGINAKTISKVSLLCFFLFIVSTAFYFYKLNSYIPLSTLPSSLWKWKNLVLTGEFSESNPLFFGRNLPVFGCIFAVNFLISKNKKSFLILLLYVVICFANPRREPVVDKMVWVLGAFFIYYRKHLLKLLGFLIPVGLVFIILFSALTNQLSFGESALGRSLASYSFASFNSLQKAIDSGYTSNSSLFLGNTFYFVYMILKYPFPSLTPPDVVLNDLGYGTVNVYTSLIAPYIDSNNNYAVFIVFIIIYAVYIGIVFAASENVKNKNSNKLWPLVIYCAVLSCVARSFMNPTFSYADILVSIISAFVVWLVFDCVHYRKIAHCSLNNACTKS